MLAVMRRAVLIVNPFASGVTEERVRAVERELAATAEVRTLLTERPRHATELTEAVHGETDAVLVFSGDGGFNEVVNGADGHVPLGFIPGGGTNVLARTLGLPRDPHAAARVVAAAFAAQRTRRISLGRVNGRRFGFGAGLGFDADLVRHVDEWGRSHDGRRPGDLAFFWEAARIVAARRGRFDPALDIEGFGRAALALVANCDPYTYAGRVPVHIAPEARFELGLDLVAPRSVRGRMLPRLLRYIFTGRGLQNDPDIVYGHDLDRVEVVCDEPTPLQADGEDLGDVERAVFEAERDAIAVLV